MNAVYQLVSQFREAKLNKRECDIRRFVYIISSLAIFAIAGCSQQSYMAAAFEKAKTFDSHPRRQLTNFGKSTVETAIRERLKDPQSAIFTWPDFIEGGKTYCGYVNSKNSFGGYVGNVIYQVTVVDTLDPPFAAVIGIGTGDASDSRSLALSSPLTKSSLDEFGLA